jgi:hypothetical protein
MKRLIDHLGFKKRNIHVFLKSKLASADASVTLLYPFSLKTKSKVTFYTTDLRTYNEIKKNHVLYNAIQEIGSIEYIWRTERKILSDIKDLLLILRAIASSFIPNTMVFHFNNIDSLPLSLLKWLPKGNIYYLDLFFICPSENFIKLIKHHSRPYQINVSSSNALLFCQSRAINGPKNKILLDDPYTDSIWMEYMKKTSEIWYKSIEKKYGKNKKIVYYVLRTFGNDAMMSDELSNLSLFKETLRTLSLLDNVLILLKPHYITDMNIVNREISRYPNVDISVTYIHPLVASHFSSFFIANFYSLALHFAKLNDNPVIEYTDYSKETLECTSGHPIGEGLIDKFFLKGQEGEVLEAARNYLKEDNV